jgi:hypothetical protein
MVRRRKSRYSLEGLLAEGHGALVGRTYTVADLRALMAQYEAAIDAGEYPAPVIGVWRLFGEIAHAIAAGEQRCCIRCDFVFRPGHLPLAIGVVQADVVDPTGSLVFGICRDCWPHSNAVWTSLQVRLDAHASGHVRLISDVVGHA